MLQWILTGGGTTNNITCNNIDWWNATSNYNYYSNIDWGNSITIYDLYIDWWNA